MGWKVLIPGIFSTVGEKKSHFCLLLSQQALLLLVTTVLVFLSRWRCLFWCFLHWRLQRQICWHEKVQWSPQLFCWCQQVGFLKNCARKSGKAKTSGIGYNTAEKDDLVGCRYRYLPHNPNVDYPNSRKKTKSNRNYISISTMLFCTFHSISAWFKRIEQSVVSD